MIGSCSFEVVSDSVLSTLFFFAVPVSHTKSQLPLFSKGKLVGLSCKGLFISCGSLPVGTATEQCLEMPLSDWLR